MMEHDPDPGPLTSGPAAPDLESGGADGLPPLPLVSGYQRLEDAILDESFPEVDLALRRGRHVHKGDERWFRFLSEAQPLLEPFYRRYGCELEQRGDGYFFLLPVSDALGKRHLGVPEMIVGQGLALCYLDPQSVQSGGVITREDLLNQLAAVMGTDALMRALNPKRKRVDERVMQRTVRQKVNEALRRLSLLGFVELLEGEQLRLAPSLMRFAEPVRGLDAPSEALKRLIERGEMSLGPGDAEAPEAEDDEPADEELEDDDASPDAAGAGASAPEGLAAGAGAAPDEPPGARLAPEHQMAAAYHAGPANDSGHDDSGHDDSGHDAYAGHDDSGRDDSGHDDSGHDAYAGHDGYAEHDGAEHDDSGHDAYAGHDDSGDGYAEHDAASAPASRGAAPAAPRAGSPELAAPSAFDAEDEPSRAAPAPEVPPEHVEFDFDWDTLPDEQT